MCVVLFAISATFSSLALLLELIPIGVKPAFVRVQRLFSQVIGLLWLIPGLLTLVGWICWVLMVMTQKVVGGDNVLVWHEQMVAFIQGNQVIPNVLDKIIQPCFGRLY